MTPVAVIPMDTPTEAIAELEYAVDELGLKVAHVGHVARPLDDIHRDHPELFQNAFRLDVLALDSDYDPFWAKCAELRVPLTAHTPTYGVGYRRSPSNYLFNQTTNFSDAGDLLCRALFLGGVTRRFPTLKFQFLECGVGWACVLFAELVHRWEKRNIEALDEYVRAAGAAEPEFVSLVREHGGELVRAVLDRDPSAVARQFASVPMLNDFAACEIESIDDVYDLFVPRFYFGCEADDPITGWAFDTRVNPMGARLRATLGSDMGHWDVPDMRGILPEAYEAVEDGRLDAADVRRFAFSNPCELFAGVNPDFFVGTSIQEAALAARTAP